MRAADHEPECVFLALDDEAARAIEDYLELLDADEDAANLVARLVRKLLQPAGLSA